MGNTLGRSNDERDDDNLTSVIDDVDTDSAHITRRSLRKRKRVSFGTPDDDETKAKLVKLDTPKYVYRQLFIEGRNSDVEIHALNHTWRLHRVYLEQCEYFRALFCGKWKDSNRSSYTLEIFDKNITYNGLNNVFASLYNNEIQLDKDHISGIIGAAAMLNLTSVLNKCADILSTYMAQDKILLCLRLADTYGLNDIFSKALEYLKYCFWRYCLSISFLKELKQYWFVKILSSDFLCVKENEMDVYTAIKMWIYLQNNPDACDCDMHVDSTRGSADHPTVLEVDRCPHLNEENVRQFFNSKAYDWRRYADILRHLRVSQLTILLHTTKTIKRDGVIPKELIDCVMRDQWNTLLVNEEATQLLDDSMDDDFFYRHCFRLGRNGNLGLNKTMWRWLGCFFGTDLLVNYSSGSIRFLRNCTAVATQQHISIKLCEKIRIHYRVIVCSEEDGSVIYDTNRRNAILEMDGSVSVGLFKVPRSTFSLHLFYLASIPGPSSTFYWDNLAAKALSR